MQPRCWIPETLRSFQLPYSSSGSHLQNPREMYHIMIFLSFLCFALHAAFTASAPPFPSIDNQTYGHIETPPPTYSPITTSMNGIAYRQNYRSVWDIIWGCSMTIFSCTWIAVHPNIRGHDSNMLSRTIQRAELMGWAILAPEVMVMWAFRQWTGARELRKLMQRKREEAQKKTSEVLIEWTITHCHFLQMGGYLFKTGEQLEYIDPLTPRGAIAMDILLRRTETVDDINDRSKGDALAKTFVVVQTLWFIGQFIARAAQRMTITELEVTTVAHAAFTGILYFCWWDKPLDVRRPIVVPFEDVPPTGRNIVGKFTKNEKDDIQYEDLIEKSRGLGVASSTPVDFGETPPELDNARHANAIFRYWHECAERVMFKDVNKRYVLCEGRPFLVRITFITIIFVISLPDYFLRRLFAIARQDTMTISSDTKANPSKIRTYYAFPSANDADFTIFVGCTLASVFGAIHCIAWSFKFHFPILQILWRASGLTLCFAPFCLIFAATTVTLLKSYTNKRWPGEDTSVDRINTLLVYVGFYSLIPYFPARLMVAALAGLELLFLPPSANQSILWLDFFPHV